MTTRRVAPVLVLFFLAACLAMLVLIVPVTRHPSPAPSVDPRYGQFLQMAAGGSGTEALAQGDALFQNLLAEQPDHPDLVLLRQRLEAARQISSLIASTVKTSPAALLEGVTDPDVTGLPVPRSRADPGTLLPPAGEAYWTRLRVFATAPAGPELSVQQVAFLDRYYELHMQQTIMEIGRQVLVTHPGSSEYLCYAAVLPLLYHQGRDDAWDQEAPFFALFTPGMLDVLSRFALLQAERPGAALAIARYRARADDQGFSPARWASDAVDACITNHRPDLAEQLVGIIIPGMHQDIVAALRLKAAEGHARCGDYGMAAQACARISAELPETRWYGRIMVAYLGYLAREEKAEQVITAAESVLQDARCQTHLAQILYLKWWALRKTDRLEEVAAVAQQLLEQFPDDPSVAPVLLERATDALARQEYDKCRELLTRLTRDFSGTESAKRATDILTRLANNAGK